MSLIDLSQHFPTLREACLNEPLEPESVEARQLQTAVNNITSPEIHRIANAGYRARIAYHQALHSPDTAA